MFSKQMAKRLISASLHTLTAAEEDIVMFLWWLIVGRRVLLLCGKKVLLGVWDERKVEECRNCLNRRDGPTCTGRQVLRSEL